MPEIFESASLIKNQIAALIEEHRDLDGVIAVLDSSKQSDDLRIRRLKKRKLLLKDRIIELQKALVPDLLA
ncbi:DUF465 domain-containing protein [Burkholderiales bacterium]|jgi:hypothetical protein|nr:DUF465 domain-containing protein [Betaproteobacteria bacterium]MBT7998266.1 DUF465 domain-containing protein [Betaproteobacteria bacterium]MDA9296140.1 DUF465 domain-containing protein [Burkholderiales bacterium]MDC1433512.1 DUF465 domain-containing protein [Burkholderiales bacterium]